MNTQRSTDPYRVLGVDRTATSDSIKRAYREQVKRTHPDRDPSPRAAQRFIEIQQAYETLRDPLMRMAHDARHRDAQRARQYAAEQNGYKERTRPHASSPDQPDIRTRSWAFIGLHLTGLVFGLVLVLGILSGITFYHWPWASIFFTLPGLALLPDAWAGLRM